VEFDGAQQVLERFAGGPAFHQIAQGVEFAVAQGAVEFEVKVDAFFPQDVGEQKLRIEPRALDTVFLKVTGGGRDDLLDRLQGLSIKSDAG